MRSALLRSLWRTAPSTSPGLLLKWPPQNLKRAPDTQCAGVRPTQSGLVINSNLFVYSRWLHATRLKVAEMNIKLRPKTGATRFPPAKRNTRHCSTRWVVRQRSGPGKWTAPRAGESQRVPMMMIFGLCEWRFDVTRLTFTTDECEVHFWESLIFFRLSSLCADAFVASLWFALAQLILTD